MAIEHRRPTERDYALSSPLSMKEPGSTGWCFQMLYKLERAYPEVERAHAEVLDILNRLETQRAWERVPPDAPYGDADAMYIATVGKRRDEIVASVAAAAARERSIRAAEQTTGETLPAHSHPDVQFAHQKAATRAMQSGISRRSQIKLDRLARDYPALHERVKAGALSVNAAAIEAGFVAPTFSAPLAVEALARALARRLSPADLASLIRALVALTEG